ncbi:MAG: 1-acyl-sn-glycerol-3-phosphate acyltransferase [Kiritimatiellae bacterium]|nr:1-acyl-sn-glycerol-3-phosphate acyltransferase [Kiritimatiellia bacterium]
MRTTTLDEFQSEIRATGGYRTPDERRAAKRAKPGAWTTFRFSLGVSHVFPMCALLEPMGKLTIRKWVELCFSSVTIAERLGMNVIVEGFRNREAYDGPVMYLSNHMSTVETILLPTVLNVYGPFSYVAKASLAHLPFLGRAAANTGMVPIGRKSPREDLVSMLKVGTERIHGGDSFLIFPQGSREHVFSRRLYSSIGAKLAERAGCPVVPLVVDTRVQPRRDTGLLRKVFNDFGPVDTGYDIRVCCGPVIPCAKAKVMHEAAFDWMAGKLEEWGLPTER